MEDQCRVCRSIKRVEFKELHERSKDNKCFEDRGVMKVVKLRDSKEIGVNCSGFSYVRSIKYS